MAAVWARLPALTLFYFVTIERLVFTRQLSHRDLPYRPGSLCSYAHVRALCKHVAGINSSHSNSNIVIVVFVWIIVGSYFLPFLLASWIFKLIR